MGDGFSKEGVQILVCFESQWESHEPLDFLVKLLDVDG